MRISYISRSVIPSRQANIIHIMKMCHAWARLGHAVTLLAVDSGEELGVDDYSPYGVAPVFEIVRYGKRNRGFVGRARGLGKLYRAVEQSTPRADLLYARHPLGVAWLGGLNIPCALEVHRPPESTLARWMLRRLFARRNFLGLVVISEALRQEYLRQFPQLHSDRIFVAHDGADLPLAEVAGDRDQAASSAHVRVGYTGHLYPGKGMELIVQVARRLPAMHFHIVGGEAADIVGWRARGVPDNLFFHGHVPHNDVHARLLDFDIVLAPYQHIVTSASHAGDISRWMSPLKIFEYMAAGRAIVSSNLPVLQEVLKDEETALLVAPQDVDGWAQAITRLAEDAGLRERLGANAYALLRQEYTWEQRAQKILDWLEQRMPRSSAVAATTAVADR